MANRKRAGLVVAAVVVLTIILSAGVLGCY